MPYRLALISTNWIRKTLLEQKALLEKLQTRKVFKKMEGGSASMIVHRDANSLPGCYTSAPINSSKRSLVFEFDRELFASRIYERWIRGSVKKSHREHVTKGSFL
jgi:guanine nucleotide-binding protein G(i) subunit alpha